MSRAFQPNPHRCGLSRDGYLIIRRKGHYSMKLYLFTALAAAATVSTAATAQTAPKRQLGAHEHGASKLAIAIDGTKVAMDLDAPGDDIVGFENEPKTAKEKAAVDAAVAKLSKPLDLFAMPPAAGCTATDAKVERKANASGHSEFEGAYTLTCTAPDKIGSIDMKFFKAFPKAEKVTVTIVSAKGQKTFPTTAKKPKVDLAGVM
jgi:Protein of unknown function (DUF2796)